MLIYKSGASFVEWGRKRIPPFYEILSLFATIVFLIYGWTSLAFFWKLPSWLKILNLSEIGVVVAYILVSSLLECLVLLMVFLLTGILLPQNWLREDFAVRGSFIMYVLTFWASIFTLNSLIGLPNRTEMIVMGIGLFASMGLVLLLLRNNAVVGHFMRSLSDRLIIFVYVWMPLSLLGLGVVIVRWLGRGLAGL